MTVVLTVRLSVSGSQFVRNTFVENELVSLRERGGRLVRQNKNVELAQSEIVSINDPDLTQFFYEHRFKRDEAVKVRH